MRGTREALRAAFPGMRPALASPVVRQVVNPFTQREEDREERDPAAPGSPERAAKCEAPVRPPLPFVPFRTGVYWYEEFPAFVERATWMVLTDEQIERDRALFGEAIVDGAPLHVHDVPIPLRDALAAIDGDEESQGRLAFEWSRVLEPEGTFADASYVARLRTVNELVPFAHEACRNDELLYLWSNI